MNYQTIELQRDKRLATVWLNRPDLRNAFNERMVKEITQVFRELGDDDSVHVIVLAARGAAFCAGADLNWMKKMAAHTHAENLADAAQLATMLRTIYLCPKPVMAKVQGDCYAGGMGLVAACDIAIAAGTANFCLSEVKLGLIPATISPYVIKAMGEHAARRYFLTGERFAASTAQRIGLIHEAVQAVDLDAVAGQITDALLAAGPQAVKQAKRLVRDVAGVPFNQSLIDDTVARIAEIRASEEAREGVQAFLEKRKPDWLQ